MGAETHSEWTEEWGSVRGHRERVTTPIEEVRGPLEWAGAVRAEGSLGEAPKWALEAERHGPVGQVLLEVVCQVATHSVCVVGVAISSVTGAVVPLFEGG
jgi:hypothetical protein